MARSTSSGQSAAQTATTDTPDTPDAQVEHSDSGVDTSLLTAQQKAVLEFEPVELTKGDRKVTARTKAQLVSLKFDGFTASDKG